MSNLTAHIKEIAKTLAPEYGPETPVKAVNRLVTYYQTLDEADKHAFVEVLVCELVAQRIYRLTLDEKGWS